ncbi:24241_t:CDS:2 [Dentiscutata erythropus]|uniref:24241_t:CDS:1 n=1 Tax=Dentiscutata erythropus TaxID=1348616 RepID=A0A9N9ED05_9GLOM|nr:24241_t:CDS:2 [Dentiscutata erythropus]
MLNANFNVMLNSSQPSVATISNKHSHFKKRMIPTSNLNSKLTAPFKVPQIHHQNQQKLLVKSKELVIQTKENKTTTSSINNDYEQISITNK